MNVSGILVIVPVAELDVALSALAALPGVDVHHTDPATGRVIVTQEAESVHREIDGLKRIKAIPQVMLAEMVHHHFEDEPMETEGSAVVPRCLQDDTATRS
jgi:nitrate reductase NapD